MYNGDGQVVSQKNALGQTVLLVYNDFGEKIEEIDPSPSDPLAPVNPLSPQADAPIQRWGYDPDGNLTLYVDARGVS